MALIWLAMYIASGLFLALMGIYLVPGLYVMVRWVTHGKKLGESFVAGTIVTGLAMWSTTWNWPIWGVLLFILGITGAMAIGADDPAKSSSRSWRANRTSQKRSA